LTILGRCTAGAGLLCCAPSHANQAQDSALRVHVPPILHLGCVVREHGHLHGKDAALRRW
jgi:hypothetical protein